MHCPKKIVGGLDLQYIFCLIEYGNVKQTPMVRVRNKVEAGVPSLQAEIVPSRTPFWDPIGTRYLRIREVLENFAFLGGPCTWSRVFRAK